VRWDYLQEVLEQFGYGHRWRNSVTTLLASSTSSVLLNGARGEMVQAQDWAETG